MKPRHLYLGALLVLLALFLAACQTAAPTVSSTQAPAATQAPCPSAEPAAACPAVPTPVVANVPFEADWAGSGHNDVTAEAFTHWNEADPKEVPADCAKCHSTPGHLDFLGADGSAAGTVDAPAAIGTTIQCVACHNSVSATKTSVVFPSGVEVTGLGPSGRCMECHQGRASRVQVDAAIDKLGLTEQVDTVSADIRFTNIHYFAAAATLYGTQTQGGYEYDGKAYDAKNDHVAGYDSCIGCHNQHTLELKVEECSVCHQGVAAVEDLKNVRMFGSKVDYDGDGDVDEGIYYELQGMQEKLLAAIQAYGKDVAGAAIAYSPASYPYFFVDTNGDGTLGEDEAKSDNSYKSWTPRLLKAAYNYQLSVKDPGAFAHGGKYIIELLYDSTEDLNTQLATPVDLSTANRIDAGHFAGSEEAFRHWDEEEEAPRVVPASCARCHSAQGLPFYLANFNATNFKLGAINQPASNGLNCATCHNDLSTFTRFEVGAVTFPSGKQADTGSSDANLCLNCHQGRESTVSVNNAIKNAAVSDNEVSDKLAFRNVHYFAAGATLFGTDAQGGYEFDGKTYVGRFMHVEPFDTCVECHDVHALTVKVDQCKLCHGVDSVEALQTIRMQTKGKDFDGDGNADEGIGEEIATLQETLYATLQAYAADQGAPLVYDAHRYPYFFGDTNGNGEIDEGEGQYKSWTPNLLRAAYNYQYSQKDPGAFAHNGQYTVQLLIDSIEALDPAAAAGTLRP